MTTTAFNLSKRSNVIIGLDMADFCQTAKKTRFQVSEIRTVDEIESGGSGFLSKSERPKILLEGHYFFKALKRVGFADEGVKQIPSVCYPKWTKRFYLGREREYSRLATATEFCHKYGLADSLALEACSWGRYQIMGANFKLAGYQSVDEFVEAMFVDEAFHLEAFVHYVMNTGLDDELRGHRWAAFARGYNGTGYLRNHYDTKLANAFRKFNGQNIDCESVLKGIHVVQAMPGIRDADPGVEGFANTSLDDRWLGEGNSMDDDIENTTLEIDDDEGLPEGGSQQSSNPAGGEPAGGSSEQPAGTSDANAQFQPPAEDPKLPGSENPVLVEGEKKVGLWTKLCGAVGGIMTGTLALPSFDLSDKQMELLKLVFPYLIIGVIIGLCYWAFQSKWFHLQFSKLKAEHNTNEGSRDIAFVQPPASGAVATLRGLTQTTIGSLLTSYAATLLIFAMLGVILRVY